MAAGKTGAEFLTGRTEDGRWQPWWSATAMAVAALAVAALAVAALAVAALVVRYGDGGGRGGHYTLR
jgi:hypothetical protein